MYDTDVAIVGAGAAGLSLAYRLCAPRPGRHCPEVTLLEAPAGPARAPRRTWCFWEEGGGEFDEAVTASWQRLRVQDRGGLPVVRRTGPLRYKMLGSAAFESLVTGRLEGAAGLHRLEAAVHAIHGGADGAEVRGLGADGSPVAVRARWVFDSRPLRRLPPARTTLLQHFRGWFLRTRRPAFDAGVVDLMDFRTPQPRHGLSFGYVLPTGPCEALVEYTEFSAAPLGEEEYDRALGHYTRRLGLGAFEIRRCEQGVIPMTDACFPRRVGPRVFRIGTAGGATRPATGYTFAAVQRQARAVADAYHRGRTPVPPPAHRVRHRTMDAVLLRAVDRGRLDGAQVLSRLFREVPTERLLRFLDGATTLPEDLAVGLHMPMVPMLRTALELPWLPRRRPADRTDQEPRG